MATKKSPLAQVNEQFGNKEKLIDALLALPAEIVERARAEEDKDAFRKRLSSAANRKLLRLHALGTTVKQRWGNKEGLVDALLGLMNRGKDQDYRSKLLSCPVAKLYDQFQGAEKRSKPAPARKKAPAKSKSREASA